jgi:hypothetical protein
LRTWKTDSVVEQAIILIPSEQSGLLEFMITRREPKNSCQISREILKTIILSEGSELSKLIISFLLEGFIQEMQLTID